MSLWRIKTKVRREKGTKLKKTKVEMESYQILDDIIQWTISQTQIQWINEIQDSKGKRHASQSIQKVVLTFQVLGQNGLYKKASSPKNYERFPSETRTPVELHLGAFNQPRGHTWVTIKLFFSCIINFYSVVIAI